MQEYVTKNDLSGYFDDIKQLFKETDMKFKETDEKFKETDKKMKALQNLFEGQWGKLMESLVEGDLIRLLNERGIRINDTSTRRKGSRNGVSFEFNIIAHNGEEIVIVEIKTTLRVNDVKKFIEKLKRAKQFMPEYKEFSIYGAIAYLRSEESGEKMAENQGLLVIRATGDSAAIVNTPDFQPKKF